MYQVWEQEVYREIVYKAPQLWFHSFEAENNMAGLSFADERYLPWYSKYLFNYSL